MRRPLAPAEAAGLALVGPLALRLRLAAGVPFLAVLYDTRDIGQFGGGLEQYRPRHPEGAAGCERARQRLLHRTTAGGPATWSVAGPQDCRGYSPISSKTPKMGMYIAMIMAPMMEPSTAIMSGSMRLVSASVVASTSWS